MPKGPAIKEPVAGIPCWVPKAVLNYLAHTEAGTPIRALARHAGCHASTVSRQVRAFEARRDDMLVDEALRRLGRVVRPGGKAGSNSKEKPMSVVNEAETQTLTRDRLDAEGMRVLRRLCEPGAVLAVAVEMEKAVVVREGAVGGSNRTAIVDREIAEAMALKEWIVCEAPGRVARYRITTAGRSALGQIVARAENKASGFAEAGAEFAGAEAVNPGEDGQGGRRRHRYGTAESPLVLLSRRRDRDGERFLSDDLVRAGERLREDFEMARLGGLSGRGWEDFLAAAETDGQSSGGTRAARARVLGALRDLGPGLGDVVLRCCCYLEGLEAAEKSMGWSARSGKIVLRIALQRLRRHYEALGEASGMMA